MIFIRGGGRNGCESERVIEEVQQDRRAGHLLTLKDTSKELKVSALPRAPPEALANFFWMSSFKFEGGYDLLY